MFTEHLKSVVDHVDGGVGALLMGLDGIAVDSYVQEGNKMDITTLKKEFGRQITFWGGGIDVQQVLPYATLPQIEDEVKKTLDIMAPGGGYVFVASHNIQADVAPERIHKLYESVLKFR